MKNAIVALTRGYPEQKNLYDELLQRNKSIYEHINKKRDYPADIILFHEGNISEKDQSYLTKESPEPLKFIEFAVISPLILKALVVSKTVAVAALPDVF